MPSKTKVQQQAFGIANAIKKGEVEPKPGTPSANIAKSMSLPDIREFASTPTKGLPKRARQSKPKGQTRTKTGATKLRGKPPTQKGVRPWL